MRGRGGSMRAPILVEEEGKGRGEEQYEKE